MEPGDQFEAVGVRVWVAGIIDSPEAQDNNVAYVGLPFLQQASNVGFGVVTQFNVRVQRPADLEPVAKRIDALFASDQDPTYTRPEKAFFAQTAKEMIELVGFTRWLGLGAVFAVLGLMANAASIRPFSGQRKRRHQTIDSRGSPGMIMVLEGTLQGLLWRRRLSISGFIFH